MIGRAFVISLPGTVVSAFICTVLFGGVTSSGSAILVQFLAAKITAWADSKHRSCSIFN